jgi:hypothetical protein
MSNDYASAAFGKYQGDFWIHDPRFEFHENTPENPMPDGREPD